MEHDDSYYSDRGASESMTPSKYKDVIELYGPSRSTCGYCAGRSGARAEGRKVYDFKAHKLTADTYQLLIDRGWRRSGQYCYFPYNKDTCCPNYSISCSATQFELSKSQIKCIDKVYSMLMGIDSTRKKLNLHRHVNENFRTKETEKTLWKRDVKYMRDSFDKLTQSPKARDRRFVASCERIMHSNNIGLEEAIQKIRDKPRNNRAAARLRLTLEDHLYPRKTNLQESFLEKMKLKHKLQIRLVHVDSQESKEIRQKEHEVIIKYQVAIHKETPDEWTMSRFENFLIDNPIKTEPLQDRDYCFPEASGDEKESITGLKNLGVDVLWDDQSDEFALVEPPQLPTHFGTYHCLYLLDDELIAVGVIDFLPKCLTTVYFFYDPKYSHLNLGIYSALVEVSIVRQLFKHYQGPSDENNLKYYYMGFYVHECKKMHYKNTFRPSYLLCPFTRRYVSAAKCLPILNERKYARFDNDHEPETMEVTLDDLYRIPVTASVLGNCTKLFEYFRWLRSNTSQGDVELLADRFLVPYAPAVGVDLFPRILVKLDAIHRALVDRHREHMARARSRAPG